MALELVVERAAGYDVVQKDGPAGVVADLTDPRDGDDIVLTVGEPMGKSGGTNTLKIVKVGKVGKARE